MDNDITEIVERIKNIYSTCSETEQGLLKQILTEIADTGTSKTYEDVWLSDYKEIPVDIDTFINSETYLGKTNRCGAAVYPFWRQELHNVFGAGNKYSEWILTGATRIGKSSTAISGTAYMLYRLMCLKDPQKFFGKKEISKFSILFFNLTKELAKGVAFREFNDTLRVSPWFCSHGSFSRSEKDFYYIPEGGKIIIDYGSDAAHALGMQVYCLVGDTKIVTEGGVCKLSELENTAVMVQQLHNDDLIYTPAFVAKTKEVTETIRIRFEDGTEIEGTSEHRLMLSDGTYKALKDITLSDSLKKVNSLYFGDITPISLQKIYYDEPIPVYDVINAAPAHNFILLGEGLNYVSHNCAVMDEINFSQAGVKDVNKAKAKMKSTYNTVAARVKGTFKHGGQVFGKIFAVSSKRSDSDFMEDYVREQMDAGAGEHMYVSDAPQWEVLPRETFSKETFYIAVGNRYQKSFVVPDNQTFPEALEELRNQGYRLLQPPVDMRSDFLADFNVALRDLAGIAVIGAASFITQESITKCINTSRRSPFYTDILQTGVKDNLSIEEFFHLNEVPDIYKRIPLYIHLDLSLTTDRTGISCGGIIGRKDIISNDGKKTSEPVFGHMFSIAIEAPRDDKISYSKVVAFICWLRKSGFNIHRISRDQFQSEYLAQELTQKGFTVDKISLDRTPDGYIAFHSVLIEERIDMLDVKLLQDELVHLQKDNVTNRVDHPSGGSKDVADSQAGWVWNAILHNPGVVIPSKAAVSAISAVNGKRAGGVRPSNTKGINGMFPNRR